MRTVTEREAVERFMELVELVEAGEEILITLNDGRAVKMRPITEANRARAERNPKFELMPEETPAEAGRIGEPGNGERS